jgi:hypothetical protein
MAKRKGRPARSLLKPTDADALRGAMERLRGDGLSQSEAGAELLRGNFYDFIDSQTEPQSSKCTRLRIVKR